MSDYSALEPRPRHPWNFEEKWTLMILVEGYDNQWKDIRNTFHKHFGIAETELSEPALRSMWHQTKPIFRGSIGEWTIIREALEATARKLNIELHRKGFDQSSGEPEFQISRKIIPQTPQRSRQNEGSFRLLTPPSTAKKLKNNAYIPCVGFRAFSTKNHGINSRDGFVAGKFVHMRVQGIPSSTSLEYRKGAIRHLARKSEPESDGLPTPFISLHRNLIRVLHYAFHNEESSIAVIDMLSIKHIEHVYSLRVRPPKYPYQGLGEYLVYGEIEKKSLILVISLREFLSRISSIPNDLFGMCFLETFKSTKESRKAMKKFLPPLDFTVGHSVGRLLQILQIPARYLESSTGIIVKDWRFPGHERWEKNSAFLQGVKEGREDLPDFIKELRKAAMLECSSESSSRMEGSASSIDGKEKDREDSGLKESSDFIKKLREAAMRECSFEKPFRTEGSTNSADEYEKDCEDSDLEESFDFISDGEGSCEDSDREACTDYIDELRKAVHPAVMESTSGFSNSLEEIEDAEKELERFSGLTDELQEIEEMLQIDPCVTEVPEKTPFYRSKIRLVDYSDSEGNN